MARWLTRRPTVATILALAYLVPGLFLWVKWQVCSGWDWFCNAPLLESLAGPWAEWLGLGALANSNASVAEALGPLGTRIFVLAALCLNAAIIFSIAKMYRWMFSALRNNPPALFGMTFAISYALPALFFYVDAMHCIGFVCDLGVLLAAVPWSILTDVHFRAGGMLAVLLMLVANGIILYAIGAWLAWPSWRRLRQAASHQ